MNWLTRFFSTKAPTPARQPAHVPSAVAAIVVTPPSLPSDAEPIPLLTWLLGCPPAPMGTPLSPAEQQALTALDSTLALPTLPGDLLPRAASLVPQMIAMLRQSDLPVPALAQRVAKDALLTAEVMRLASSPFYRAQGTVTDLGQAITLIGVTGLNTVIARVVLKPIFETALGPLSARAAPRLWEHADGLAYHTALLAGQAGESPFDGTLAGLLYGCGHTMALRIIDRSGVAVPLPPSLPFADAFAVRAHRLFGSAAQRWSITPGFSALATDARTVSLAASSNALACALQQALPRVMADRRADRMADGKADGKAAEGAR